MIRLTSYLPHPGIKIAVLVFIHGPTPWWIKTCAYIGACGILSIVFFMLLAFFLKPKDMGFE